MKNDNPIMIILAVLIVSAIVGGVCWTYAINSLLMLLGKIPVIVFWQGALIGFCPFLGQFGIPTALIMWIVNMCV